MKEKRNAGISRSGNTGFIVSHRRKLPILAAILLVAIILRFWKLGEIPPGVTNDEIAYIYNAYSIWKTGNDIHGRFLPVSFEVDNSFSPVPVYVIAPVVGLFGLSPFWGRFVFAAAGVGSVYLMYAIGRRLFGQERISLLCAALLGISPWHLHFSRTAYETSLALFFYLLGTLLFLTGLTKKRYLSWSLLAFVLGFYSYHATKIFFLAYIPVLLLYASLTAGKITKGMLFFGLGTALLCGTYFISLRTQPNSRLHLMLWNDTQRASAEVISERTKSIAPEFLKNMYSNKLFYFGRIIKENYLEAFSPQFLFLYGEPSGLSNLYGLQFHGMMYSLEAVLVLAGLYVLIRRGNRSVMVFILLSLAIAPFPSVFAIDKTYAARSIMMIPFLLFLTGSGIEGIWLATQNRSRSVQFVVLALMCILYGYSLSNYLYQYYFRFPVYGAEAWFDSTRKVVRVMANAVDNHASVDIVEPSGYLMLHYAFYRSVDPRIIQSNWSDTQHRAIGNVHFLVSCYDTHRAPFDKAKNMPVSTLYIVRPECHPESRGDNTINDFGDQLRVIWKMYDNSEI